VANGPAKLPGWWDNTQNKWLEDRYQVGSDSGNMAWAMLALLSIDDVSARSRFPRRCGTAWHLGCAMGRLARYWRFSRAALLDTNRRPTHGHGKSTEHNGDLAAAFGLLALRTGDSHWRDMATAAEHFVDTMWDPALRLFSPQAPPKTASRAIRFWSWMLKSGL